MIYVDESGKPNFTDPENYVLAAVIVHESDWQAIDAMVSSLKNRFFPSSDADTIEFHVVEIVSGKGRYKGMSMQQRFKLLEEIAKLIHHARCTIVAVLIDKKKIFPQFRDPEWVELWAWRLLCERLELFISKHNQQRGLSPRDYGLICMDSENPQADNRIRQRIRRFRRHGSIHVDSEHLIEDPFFLSSVNANIVQLADFVAWIVRRTQRRGATSKHDSFYQQLFDIIKNRFDERDGKIKGVGLKLHP